MANEALFANIFEHDQQCSGCGDSDFSMEGTPLPIILYRRNVPRNFLFEFHCGSFASNFEEVAYLLRST